MKLKLRNLLLLSLVFTVAGCVNKQKEEQVVETTKSGLVKSDFQTVLDGDSTNLFVLNNNNGVEVAITNYGGRIVSVMVPDKEGNFKDVVLGFDNIEDYTATDNNFGATIGRYGNRIAHGTINIDGVE